jgi:flagellar L-ring protein precursor FlgH
MKDRYAAGKQLRKGRCGMALLPILAAALLMTLMNAGCSQNLYNLHERNPIFAEEKPPGPAGTIWPGMNTGNNLFADNKARFVNDVVTINMDESLTGANNATTNTSRVTANTAGVAGITQLNPSATLLSKYELGGSSTNSLKGDGATSRNGNLSGKITARVTKVLPNGSLAIEGRKQLTVNAEDQYVILTGIIRTDDITATNVISSSNIADARIYYTGKGVVDDKQRPGWMTRVIDWVWPF